MAELPIERQRRAKTTLPNFDKAFYERLESFTGDTMMVTHVEHALVPATVTPPMEAIVDETVHDESALQLVEIDHAQVPP